MFTKRWAVSLALVAAVFFSVAGSAIASPARVTYRTAPNGMKVLYVNGAPHYNACTNTFHVYTDAVVYRNNGDDSIRVGVTQQWYQDSGGAYCGYLSGRTNAVSNDCWPRNTDSENVVWVVDEIFNQAGSDLGGFSNATDSYLGCNQEVLTWGADHAAYVPCGTTIRTFGSWLEAANGDEFAESQPDGEDVGGFGNWHDICVN